MLLDEQLAQEVLKAALKQGGEFAELYAERSRSASLSLEDSRLERSSTGFDAGVSIRVTRGRSISFVSTDSLEEVRLMEAARPGGGGACERRAGSEKTHARGSSFPTCHRDTTGHRGCV